MSASAAPGQTPGTRDGQAAGRAGSVNESLTANRRQAVVENPREYAAFVRRILKAYARRLTAGDVESPALMAQLADTIDASIRDARARLREHGYPLAEIRSRLGVTRHAAQQRREPAVTRRLAPRSWTYRRVCIPVDHGTSAEPQD